MLSVTVLIRLSVNLRRREINETTLQLFINRYLFDCFVANYVFEPLRIMFLAFPTISEVSMSIVLVIEVITEGNNTNERFNAVEISYYINPLMHDPLLINNL